MRHPSTSEDGPSPCRTVRWCAMSMRVHAPLVDCVLARRSAQSTTSQLDTRSTRGNGCDIVVIALSCELALPVIRKRRRVTWRCLANLTNARIGRSISKNRASPSLKRTVAYRFEEPALSGASREFEAADDSAALALGLAQALAWICPVPPSARARSLSKSAMSLSTECPQNELWRLRFLPHRRFGQDSPSARPIRTSSSSRSLFEGNHLRIAARTSFKVDSGTRRTISAIDMSSS
jgi:hypothetical protein